MSIKGWERVANRDSFPMLTQFNHFFFIIEAQPGCQITIKGGWTCAITGKSANFNPIRALNRCWHHAPMPKDGIVTLSHIWQTAWHENQTDQLPTPSFSF